MFSAGENVMKNAYLMNKPLRAKAVFFKGKGSPLRDRLIVITEKFLIVANGEEDDAPTWYAIDKIDRLEGVQLYHG